MSRYDEILASLDVSPQLVGRLAERFSQALSGSSDHCGLKMLDSRFQRPTGLERGEALALDFGGTNLRLSLIRLEERSFQVLKEKVVSIKDNRWGQNLAAESVDGEQLFDYIAAEMETFVTDRRDYRLGHCFSFPFRPLSVNSGLLLEWTKEIKTRGVVGRDVNHLLREALARRGLGHIKPAAILNDTVATLLCAAYQDQHADAGSICGTGYNACLLDSQGRIINLEAGNFFTDLLPVNQYDAQLDLASVNSGHQRLEKMVSGAYLGELFRLMAVDLAHQDDRFPGLRHLEKPLAEPGSIDTRELSSLLAGGAMTIGASPYQPDPDETDLISSLVRDLVIRAARLVAASQAGMICYLDPRLQRRHLIGIDGALYEKMPLFAPHIRTALDEQWSGQAHQVEIRLMKDASGLGAALAALMATGP